VWPIVLRAQIVLTSATLSLVAAWRLTGAGQLLGPLLLAGGLWVVFAAAVLTRGERSGGESALEAWAAAPNSGFWVVPAATALAGSPGAMVAVLANVINTAWGFACVHLMRRDAPIRQRRSTTWVDQSPLAASAIGLLLHAAGHAPASTKDILTLAGPLLAFSGAALFAGSVVHPHNLGTARPVHVVWRLGWLSAVRVFYFLLVATLATSEPLAVVAALTALSAPSFQPIQLAVLYGYRSGLVNAAVRWEWALAPFGLGLAALLR
jgi:predicted permease